MVITSKTNEAIFAFVDSDEHEELAIEYVRELGRCEDCKHKPLGKDDPNFWEWYGKDCKCPWFCDDTYYMCVPPEDFFCAYGEVKDEL